MTRHDQLFEEYVAALQERRLAAQAWWDALVAHEIREAGSEEEGTRRLQTRWPFGPASHPYIIAVYRRYFLLCEALNEEIEAQNAAAPPAPDGMPREQDWGTPQADEEPEREQSVPGWVLLVDMLPGRHNDLAKFLEGLVFKPIATSAQTARFE